MLKYKIKVMSFMEAFQYVYCNSGSAKSKDFAIISIQDYKEEEMGMCYKPGGHLKAALNVHFLDIDHEMLLLDPGAKLMTDEDAVKIREFVEELNDRDDIDELIIHCFAGASRSPAVAAAILYAHTGNDDQIFKDSYATPNMYVYHKVLKAYGLENDGQVFNRDESEIML